MKQYLLMGLVFILCACQTQQPSTPIATSTGAILLSAEENPYAPKPEDASLIKAGIILTSVDLSEVSETGRTKITVLGSMPSVCDELRIKVSLPTNAYEIKIEIYSIENPNMKCENVFQQIETNILLGEYSSGQYSIWVNDSFIGSMVSY